MICRHESRRHLSSLFFYPADTLQLLVLLIFTRESSYCFGAIMSVCQSVRPSDGCM